MEYVSKGDLKGRLLHIKAEYVPPFSLYVPCWYVRIAKTTSSSPDDIDMPQLLLSYSNQVALGMLYLSDKGLVHRDLAARNIVVSEQDICKVMLTIALCVWYD